MIESNSKITKRSELTWTFTCTKIIDEKKFATALLKDTQVQPSGHLTITAVPSMCDTFLAELLPKFQQEYSKILLTIDSSSTVKNLLQHGIDIALRVTATPSENYIARLITSFHFVICATPLFSTASDFNKDRLAVAQKNIADVKNIISSMGNC